MDFAFTEREEAFREEVRQFLSEELPPGWIGYTNPALAGPDLGDDESWEFSRVMARKLGERGWLALAWPTEYGGQARSHIEHAIFCEEMTYNRAPGVDQIGVLMLGPTLIVCGTDEQKSTHLRAIARGETWWCEGFSEPEAGSDLASVRIRAVEKDDAFYIDGQKVWTSLANRAEWCALLTRTDPEAPKHKGLSFFVVDMKSPGVTVGPLEDAADGRDLNEVFFDNVRVPKGNLVGEKNRGWEVAMTLLSFERSGVEWIGSARRLIDDLVGYARTVEGVSPLMRHRLADMATEVELSRLMAYRVAWMQDRGLLPEFESSVVKVFSTEVLQRVANTGMQLIGPYGQIKRKTKWAPLEGLINYYYICTRGPTIAGGTSEVQRNVIALRGLGLPR